MNAGAATAMAVNVVNAMGIDLNARNAQQISLLSPQSMMALLKLHQLKPSLQILAVTLLPLQLLQSKLQ
jgi:hypothetical protein